MITTVKRWFTVIGTILFFCASLGIIVWITGDERARLAKQHLNEIMTALQKKEDADTVSNSSSSSESERVFNDIDQLLNNLSNDELPQEGQ